MSLPAASAFEARALDAAEHQLFTVGYRALELQRLAAELEVDPALLLAQYPTEEALTLAVARRLQTRMAAFFDELEAREPDPVVFLRENLNFVTRTIGSIHPAFYAELKQHAPDCWREVQGLRRNQIQRLEGILAAGHQAGLLRPDLDPKLATTIYLAAIEALADPERMAAEGYTFTTALETVLAVFLDGIRVQLD